ncbi:MAG TPA: hypothetical protein PK987_06460 [Ferruginibacter sp.]|nr:hypothetical protein [Ferruginibacter sp.]
MKSILILGCIAFFAISCNNNATEKSTAPVSDSTAAVKYEYPYTLDKPYQDWQPGDQQNAVNVMKGLKAWENNNIAECVTYFGDSCDLQFDNFRAVLPHDSLANFFATGRAKITSIKVEMQDWESVISKDKKDQWVTLWYNQTITNKDGKTQMISVVNDAKIVNGKIVVLSENTQRIPDKK